jgi:hypothetical protein
MAEVREARFRDARAPDLLEEELLGARDRSWVEPVYDLLQEKQRKGKRIQLSDLEFRSGPGGWLALAATDDTLRGQVRTGDTVIGGFGALRDRDGDLGVWPRIFRVACANGAIMEIGAGEAVVCDATTAPNAIREILEEKLFTRATGILRSAAATPVRDPLRVLALAGAATPASVVRGEWGRDEDRTAWGLVNIVTANARAAPSLPQRFELEKDAGRILEAALVRTPRDPVGAR